MSYVLEILITLGIAIYAIGQINSGTTTIREKQHIHFRRTNPLWGKLEKIAVEGKAAKLNGIAALVNGFVITCLMILRMVGVIENWSGLIMFAIFSALFFDLLGQYFSFKYSPQSFE